MSLAKQFGDLNVYLGCDHSQLEIRVLAQMSGDEKLIKLIQSGEDLHSAVGHELTGVSIEKIRKQRDIRTAMKQLHFGIIFGMTAKSVFNKLKNDARKRGESFDMTFPEVEKLYNSYFKKFRGVAAYIERQHTAAQEQSQVSTLFGFVREIALMGDDVRGTYWANQAVNTPIQGTAHTLMLIALAILGMKPKTYNLLQSPSMEVHDALYVFTPVRLLQETCKQFIDLMEQAVLAHVKKWWPEVNWVVPLRSEAKAGFRLGVMVEYNYQPTEEFLEQWCQANRQFQLKLQKEIAGSLEKGEAK